MARQSATDTRSRPAPLPDSVFHFIVHAASGYGGWFLLMALLETGQAASNILVPYAIGRIVDTVSQGLQHPGDWLETLKLPLLLFAGLNLGEILFSRASGACLILIGPRIRMRTTRKLYAWLQYHSHRYFSNHFAGALAHRISETAMSVNHILWTVLFDFWPVVIVFAISIGLLIHTHKQLGLFVAGWAFLYVAISYWLATRCEPYARTYAEVRSKVNGKIVDSVTNITNARLFARLGYERDYLESFLDEEKKAARRTFWYMERVRWFQFISAAILRLGILYYALSLWASGQIGVGDFTMTTGLALLIIGDARNLSRRFLEFFEYIGTVSNGVKTIIQPHELTDHPAASELMVEQGRIEFRNLSFAYIPEQWVFQNMNVVIPAGQKVGLVGLSGSGKSTFAHLILRNYDPQQGQILIDDVDIATVTQESLHRQVNLIPQDPTLFHRTLRENIAYGKPKARQDEITRAARLARTEDFIQTRPEGYEAMVGERGVKLSGGQRQRIAIARVLLRQSPILILDEATSSLDSITEKAIQDSLEQLMLGKTVIVIAHRLSTIANLDRILVFDQGQIVEEGTHDDLLSRQGAYYRLWTMQSAGFLPDEYPDEHQGQQ